MVPAKHASDGLIELSVTGLVDAAGIDPAVLQAVDLCLIDTESQLSISHLVLTRLLLNIIEGNLFIVVGPGMGEDRVGSWRRGQVFGQRETPVRIDLKQAHSRRYDR